MGHRNSLIGSLIVLCFLLLTFAGCSKAKELAPALVLKKAYAATTEEVTSYHFSISGAVTADGMGEIGIFEGEGDYLAPGRMRGRGTNGLELGETISIGNKLYMRESESSPWRMREFPQEMPPMSTRFAGMVDPQKNLEFMKSPSESVVKLDDEAIDGVKSWRYRTSVDFLEAQIQAMEEETDPELKASLQELVEIFRKQAMTQTTEVWIGKEDYLVRQLRIATSQNAVGSQEFGDITIPEGTRFTVTMTLRLSGFNEPVEIEAPSVTAGVGISFPPNSPTPTPPTLTSTPTLELTPTATPTPTSMANPTTIPLPQWPLIRLRQDGQVYSGVKGNSCWPVDPLRPLDKLCGGEGPFPWEVVDTATGKSCPSGASWCGTAVPVPMGESIIVEIDADDQPTGLQVAIYDNASRSHSDPPAQVIELETSFTAPFAVDVPAGTYYLRISGQWDDGNISYKFKMVVTE